MINDHLDDLTSQIKLYKTLVDQEPEITSHYWELGLIYLLFGQEKTANETWFLGLMKNWTSGGTNTLDNLVSFLEKSARHQEKSGDPKKALQIRQKLIELSPEDLENILHVLELQLCLGQFTPEYLEECQIIEILDRFEEEFLDTDLLIRVILAVLDFPTVISVDLLEASLPLLLNKTNWLEAVMGLANKMAYDHQRPSYAADIAQICLKFSPNNIYILNGLLKYYQSNNSEALLVSTAWNLYNALISQPQQITYECYFLSRILLALLKGNSWLEIKVIVKQFQLITEELTRIPEVKLDEFLYSKFWALGFPLLYLFDDPVNNRLFFNWSAKIFQFNLTINISKPQLEFNTIREINQPLKIGYIAHTLRKHSVGWLSRWLFNYHHKQDFQLFFYLLGQVDDELTENWIYPNAYKVANFGRNFQEVIDEIIKDKVNILVDLDSLTNNITAQVMSSKAAPIQVTWLGSDASGLPAIDYFIVDPYVVTNDAQNYYQETLWTLPQTYLAVDGFEIGKMTLTRQKINVTEDAIVYLSVQNKIKSNPAILRLQLQIIKAVPKSIFLIKGGSDNNSIRELIYTISQELDLNFQCIKFLPLDPDEETHRANLAIADIVLDTYPYNGATTTLETLWMGIPLVTRVGEQFAARNSYAFLRQVGVSEGIAWTDQEYIDWGVRFGLETDLRIKVKKKLQSARWTSPLWQAETFTREMEKAYQQMWQNYCLSQQQQEF